MVASAALLAWAVLLAVAAPLVLRRAGWQTRSPRLAVAIWQATSLSFVAALVLGGLSLAVPATVLSGGLADLLANCVMAVRDAYRTPVGGGAAGAGLVLAAAVTVRVGWCLLADIRSAAKRRRQHARGLALVARRDDALGALVVQHGQPQAYCVPGRTAAIVVTTATVDRLPPDQLAAVLAHERAHLRARHHLAVAAAGALARALPRIPLLREAAVFVPLLVEMAADDAAGRGHDRAKVATALAALADAATPIAALGAAGTGALARVQRLLRPAAPLGVRGTTAALLVAVALLLAPGAAAIAPAWAAGPMANCDMRMTY
jgi:Zn-dependent protease with chaperone function